MDKKRRIGLIFGSIFIALIAFILLLPTLLSTQVGIQIIERFVGDELTVKEMHLSWFGEQKIEDLRYRSKRVQFRFERFTTDSSLLTLLLTQRASDTELIKPRLVVEVSESSKKHRVLFLPFKGGVQTEDGEVILQRQGISVAKFQAIDVTLDVKDQTLPITLVASGKTVAEGKKGRFEIRGSIERDDTSSEMAKWITNKLKLPKNTALQYKLNANFTDFPLVKELALHEVFGPSVSMKIDGVASSSENGVQVGIDSPKVNANLSAIGDGDHLRFADGSRVHMQISKELYKDLVQPVTMDVQFKDVSMPLSSWKEVRGTLNIALSDAVIMQNDLPFTLSHTQIHLSTPDLSQLIQVAADTTIRYQNAAGSVTGNLSLAKPLTQPLSPYRVLSKLNLKAKNAPTALLGKEVMAALGPTLNLRIETENDKVTIDASSKRLNAKDVTFRMSPKALVLHEPTSIRYTLENSYLASQAPLTLNLSRLSIPRQAKQISFEGSFSASHVNIKPLPQVGTVQLSDASLSISASRLSEIKWFMKARATLSQGLLNEVLGPAVNVDGSGSADLLAKDIPQFQLTSVGKSSEVKLQGSLKDNLLTLSTPIEFDGTLTPKAFNLIKPEHLSDVKLIQPAAFDAEIAPFQMHLPEGKLTSPFHLSAKFDLVKLKKTKAFSLSDCSIDVTLGDSETHIESKGEAGKGSYDISLAFEDQKLFRLDAKLSTFNTSILNQFHPVSDILGKTIDLDLSFGQSSASIDLTSDRLSMDGQFKVKDHQLTSGPLNISYLLEPMLLKKYYPNINLLKPTRLDAKIDALSLPLKPSSLFDIDWNYKKITFDARATVSEAILSQGKKTAALQNLKLHLDRSKMKDPIEFDMEANVALQKQRGKSKVGHAQFSGSLEDFYDANGAFSISKLSLAATAHLKNLPTLLFVSPYPSLIFGDYLNAQMAFDIRNMNGTIDGDISSPHCQARVDAFVTNGNLSLTKPLYAKLTLTPGLSKLLFSDANLLVVSAKEPVQVTIDNKNVSIPLRDPSWKKVRIGRGQIDFGKLIVSAKGTAKDLNEIFKTKSSPQSMLWFAPLDFSIKSGVMNIQRTEILYDMAYQIAIWGKINFPKRYVDMILGLTAQSLHRAFGLNVPSNYVLTIDVEGPFGNVKVDKGDAVGKIALIIADQSGLAPQKGIPGAVFGIIQGFAHDQSDVPPPKRPFPWEQ